MTAILVRVKDQTLSVYTGQEGSGATVGRVTAILLGKRRFRVALKHFDDVRLIGRVSTSPYWWSANLLYWYKQNNLPKVRKLGWYNSNYAHQGGQRQSFDRFCALIKRARRSAPGKKKIIYIN